MNNVALAQREVVEESPERLVQRIFGERPSMNYGAFSFLGGDERTGRLVLDLIGEEGIYQKTHWGNNDNGLHSYHNTSLGEIKTFRDSLNEYLLKMVAEKGRYAFASDFEPEPELISEYALDVREFENFEESLPGFLIVSQLK